MARGFFPFGPFMCGLGVDKQIASSYEIMHFYAQATVINMFYLFYVPFGFKSFIHFMQNLMAHSEHDYKPLLRSYVCQHTCLCIYCI